VAAAAEYDYAYTFLFSPREGTEAAEMVEQFVDPAVAAERFQRLRIVVERSALAKHRERIGRVEEVIVEGPSKKDPSVVSGRTRQNKLVHFPALQPLRVGSYATVEVVSAAPHHLMGRFVELVAEPTHRRRIPVLAG
jgi:tRNA-2-methylthio-N6-dimethylallyladenosine synthase